MLRASGERACLHAANSLGLLRCLSEKVTTLGLLRREPVIIQMHGRAPLIPRLVSSPVFNAEHLHDSV